MVDADEFEQLHRNRAVAFGDSVLDVVDCGRNKNVENLVVAELWLFRSFVQALCPYQ